MTKSQREGSKKRAEARNEKRLVEKRRREDWNNKSLAKWRTVLSSSWLPRKAPEETALEHREIDNVAGFPVELERVDDGESSNRQDFELEGEIGGKRDRCETAPVDGN